VNINHDVQGNPDLNPEKGFSAGAFWDQNFTANDWKIGYSINALYLDVRDRIEMVLVKDPSTYKYMNMDKYRNMLFSANVDFKKDQLALSLRGSVSGTSVGLNGLYHTSPTDYQYLVQAGASANYKLKNTKTAFALYYKYTGPGRNYVLETEATGFRLGKTDDFHMMNFIVSQPFWKDHMELSVGVKNIFDVTTINTTATAGTAHTGAADRLNLYYGRSYFARLIYQF
jgi:outer membrane receptor for ferrienterochelin and colicins